MNRSDPARANHLIEMHKEMKKRTYEDILTLFLQYPGIKQVEICSALGLSPKTVSRYVQAIRENWQASTH